MAEVVFLTREPRRGAKTVIGPVTKIAYTITPHGTPVSEYDVNALLEMVEAPCCGPGPFEGMVRSFGVTVPTTEQLRAVPQHLWDAKSQLVKEPSRVEKLYEKKKYDKPEPADEKEEVVVVVEEVVEIEEKEDDNEEVV